MAFRSMGYLSRVAKRLRVNALYTTATPTKLKAYAPPADNFQVNHQKTKPKQVKGDVVPVYVALGMITISVSLGVYTVYQQLCNSPSVRVSKKTRETLTEIEDPDRVVDESRRFINKSLFRKMAHVREPERVRDAVVHKPRVETLKDLDVDLKIQTNRRYGD